MIGAVFCIVGGIGLIICAAVSVFYLAGALMDCYRQTSWKHIRMAILDAGIFFTLCGVSAVFFEWFAAIIKNCH